jgi:hypothetical protein
MSLDEVRLLSVGSTALPIVASGKHIGFGGDPVTHDSSSVALQLKLKLIYKMIAALRVDL